MYTYKICDGVFEGEETDYMTRALPFLFLFRNF